MSFVGSIATPLRRVLVAYASELHTPVLLPCAGNFTVGSALRSGGYMGRITGCDITLYTSALGAFLAGYEMPVTIREDCPEHLRCFLDLSSQDRFVASVSLMLDLRFVWKRQNVWHRRVLANYERNWPQLMDKTIAKLHDFKAHMTQGGGCGYLAQDAAAFLDEQDYDNAVFVAPPTYGSKGYIVQERMLAASLQWQQPSYTELNFTDMAFYEKIVNFRDWMAILEFPVEGIEKLLGDPVAVVHRGRNSVAFAYAGHSRKRIVTRSYFHSKSPGPIFPSNQPVTGEEEVGVAFLDVKQSVRLNELFMSSRVDYFLDDVALSIAFCLNRKIIGKADFCLGKGGRDWSLPESGNQIYQRADLAVPSVEPRLAKLVLMLIQSREVKSLLDEKFKEDWKFVTTTAFSRKPVSMKYRGVFKLHKRMPDASVGDFKLNYYGELGLWTLQEGFEQWQRKYRRGRFQPQPPEIQAAPPEVQHVEG